MGFLDNIPDNTPPPRPRTNTTPSRVADSRDRPYALGALKRECDELASTASCRNDKLRDAAWKLMGFVNTGALTEDEYVDALLDAGRRASSLSDHPFPDTEIMATLNHTLSKGAAQGLTRTVPERPSNSPAVVEPAPQPQPTRSRFAKRLLTPTGLRALPEPAPLIDNVLDQGTTALLYGKWASSKSFIALDWACSVATGRPWQGRATNRTRVLYVVAEGVAGFSGRLDAWEVGWQTKIDNEWMEFLPMPVNLLTRDVDELVNLVRHGEFGFIVLDTLARCMVGGDENSAKDAGMAVDAMAQLMYATPHQRGVVLGVHHTGKDGKTLRGSSAFESGVDTVYFTERDGQAVSLKRTKRKDGPEHDVHQLRLNPITGTDSCAIEALTGDENGGNGETESVGLLKRIFSEMFGTTGVANTELRAVAMDYGMSQATFYRARADLLREGYITNTGSGARAFFELANQRPEAVQGW